MSSMNCTLGSMTQMSAPRMSWIWLEVLRIRPVKIDACCVISMLAKAMPKMMAKYLARLPISIFRAIHVMALPPQTPSRPCEWSGVDAPSGLTPLGGLTHRSPQPECRQAELRDVVGDRGRVEAR